jgi:hypothetical protein
MHKAYISMQHRGSRVRCCGLRLCNAPACAASAHALNAINCLAHALPSIGIVVDMDWLHLSLQHFKHMNFKRPKLDSAQLCPMCRTWLIGASFISFKSYGTGAACPWKYANSSQSSSTMHLNRPGVSGGQVYQPGGSLLHIGRQVNGTMRFACASSD